MLITCCNKSSQSWFCIQKQLVLSEEYLSHQIDLRSISSLQMKSTPRRYWHPEAKTILNLYTSITRRFDSWHQEFLKVYHMRTKIICSILMIRSKSRRDFKWEKASMKYLAKRIFSIITSLRATSIISFIICSDSQRKLLQLRTIGDSWGKKARSSMMFSRSCFHRQLYSVYLCSQLVNAYTRKFGVWLTES